MLTLLKKTEIIPQDFRGLRIQGHYLIGPGDEVALMFMLIDFVIQIKIQINSNRQRITVITRWF